MSFTKTPTLKTLVLRRWASAPLRTLSAGPAVILHPAGEASRAYTTAERLRSKFFSCVLQKAGLCHPPTPLLALLFFKTAHDAHCLSTPGKNSAGT